jgi:DNA-damage-inducible protein J
MKGDGIMSTSVMQFRVDDELKAQATEICENLGLDLPTALRMFMKRTVMVNGIPFNMTLPQKDYKADRAVRALHELSDAARENGTADMTLEEINAEIDAARAERSGG